MYVAPAYRGPGLAAAAARRAAAIAREHGCRADPPRHLRLPDRRRRPLPLRRLRRGRRLQRQRQSRPLVRTRRSDDRADLDLVPTTRAGRRGFERERAALEVAIGEWVARRHPPRRQHGGARAGGQADRRHPRRRRGPRDLARSASSPSPGSTTAYAPYLPEEMHWFCKPHPARRTHHLHLVPTGGDALCRRARLPRPPARADPALARRYATLKRDLAARFRDDREAYTEAKADSSARPSILSCSGPSAAAPAPGRSGTPSTWISKWRWQPTRAGVAGLADRADPLAR